MLAVIEYAHLQLYCVDVSVILMLAGDWNVVRIKGSRREVI